MAVSLVSGSGKQVYAGSGGIAGRVGGGITIAPAAAVVPGDLMVVVVGSSKQYASVSTGWTQITSIGSGSSWLSAFRRVADGTSNDTCVVALSSSGSYAAGMIALRAPLSFDANSVESSQQNCTTGAGASYALGTTLSGVGTGELSIALGGMHGSAGFFTTTAGVSGASWTLESQGGYSGALQPTITGGCMTATCPTTGTPAIPSVTYSDSSSTYGKFIFGAVIKEGAAVGGAGLFWGMH